MTSERTAAHGSEVTVTPPADGLASLLSLTAWPGDAGCAYMIGGLTAGAAELEAAAQMIAEDAMRIRCGESPVMDKWCARRDGGQDYSESDKRAVEVFVQPVFGLPTYDTTAMEKIRNHLEGFVAELLWNRLIRDRTVTADGRTLVHAEEVKADPTGTGADGLVVYEVTDGTLVFQLWEIKKHAATTHISATIKRAADQLAEHGPRYLAMLTAPGTKHPGPLGRLYADLVPLWLENSPRAGIGISVATSTTHLPPRSTVFTNVAPVFPNLDAPGQREGLLVAVTDFPVFADRVKEIVWTGL
ncbi:hypothetical protein AB0L00_38015 [Actinoallomurus sp. NPDC052308]|uniref:hypothetical protein n=1 Tax=Actinoallomurus sp. NPDC052308 TaxID=3155530 RepID=UPI00344A2124